jgi:Lrp/AsnC family transcriptional regulator for asnA, asnC and gidA
MPRVTESTSVVLDEIDKAIIRELQVDGRMSFAQLGPRVGLSQAAARQRVNRLMDSSAMQVVAVTDPLMVGFEVQAMVGVCADGDVRSVSEKIAQIEEVDYVVVTAGRFDLLVEVVCENNEQLLTLVNEGVRSVHGVRSTELFTYLHLEKQSYSWGTR